MDDYSENDYSENPVGNDEVVDSIREVEEAVNRVEKAIEGPFSGHLLADHSIGRMDDREGHLVLEMASRLGLLREQ